MLANNYTQNRTRNLLGLAKKIPLERLSAFMEAPSLPLFSGMKLGVLANSTEAENLQITQEIKNSFYRFNYYGKKVAYWHNTTDEKNTPYSPTAVVKPKKNELPPDLIKRIEKADKELAQSGLSKKLFIELNRIDVAIQNHEDSCDSWIAVEDCNYIMYAKASKKSGTKFHRHLIIDIDQWDGNLELVSSLYPHWLVFNPNKPTSLQVGFLLSEEIMRLGYGEKSKECEWFDFARGVFNQILGGDRCFVLNAAKNPLGKGLLHPDGVAMRDSSMLFDYKPYSIKEIYQLALYKAKEHGLQTVKIEKESQNIVDFDFGEFRGANKGKNENYKFDPNSRNCQLFAYLSTHPHAQNADLFFDQKNGFSKYCRHIRKAVETHGGVLPPDAEVKATIRSVANWYWNGLFSKKHYAGKFKFANEKKQRLKMQAIAKMTTILEPKFKKNPLYRLSEAEKNLIADQLGISLKTVSNYATEVRKELNSKKSKPVSRSDEIEFYRSKGYKWEQIADQLNISVEAAKKSYQRAKKQAEF